MHMPGLLRQQQAFPEGLVCADQSLILKLLLLASGLTQNSPQTDHHACAAAAGALYYFALAHQPDFDVRWCKGPIGEQQQQQQQAWVAWWWRTRRG
jgi:hypothetical protein